MTTLELALDTEEQISAGARSRVYALFAEGFAFPDAPLAERFLSRAWLEELADVVAFLPYAFVIPDSIGKTLALAPATEVLQHDYIRLFEVGAGRPYCPLYEGAHRGGRMKIMEELVRFYEHFGLKPSPGDQPDHLCAEFQFMHYLTFKEVASPARDLGIAQRDFLYRHLCKWLPRLTARLDDAREPSFFYSALSSVAAGFCRADLESLKQTDAGDNA